MTYPKRCHPPLCIKKINSYWNVVYPLKSQPFSPFIPQCDRGLKSSPGPSPRTIAQSVLLCDDKQKQQLEFSSKQRSKASHRLLANRSVSLAAFSSQHHPATHSKPRLESPLPEPPVNPELPSFLPQKLPIRRQLSQSHMPRPQANVPNSISSRASLQQRLNCAFNTTAPQCVQKAHQLPTKTTSVHHQQLRKANTNPELITREKVSLNWDFKQIQSSQQAKSQANNILTTRTSTCTSLDRKSEILCSPVELQPALDAGCSDKCSDRQQVSLSGPEGTVQVTSHILGLGGGEAPSLCPVSEPAGTCRPPLAEELSLCDPTSQQTENGPSLPLTSQELALLAPLVGKILPQLAAFLGIPCCEYQELTAEECSSSKQSLKV